MLRRGSSWKKAGAYFGLLASVIRDWSPLTLRTRAQETTREGVAIRVMDASTDDVLDQLESLAKESPLDPVALASTVPYKLVAKWDWALSEGLLNEEYGHRDLDVMGAWRAANLLVGGELPPAQ